MLPDYPADSNRQDPDDAIQRIAWRNRERITSMFETYPESKRA